MKCVLLNISIIEIQYLINNTFLSENKSLTINFQHVKELNIRTRVTAIDDQQDQNAKHLDERKQWKLR